MNLPPDSIIQTNIPLCRYSTFQIGGPAQYFAQPATREQLMQLLEYQRQNQLQFTLIGRGSNVLFSDEGFPGLVICLQRFENDRVFFNPAQGTVKASAGVSLFRLSALCQEKGASGLEFTCHIPGTVGGAVWMNAGFGRRDRPYQEIKDVLESVTAINPAGELVTLFRDEIEFDYRKSSLDGYFILDAIFRVQTTTPEQVREEVRSNFAYRNSVQDLRYPSAGSVFKNPKKQSNLSSGQLIEKVGLKGTKVGGAMISEKHGNFILNIGQAKAVDVLTLVHLAKIRVKDSFGIELEPEVRIVMPETQIRELEVGMAV